MKFQMFTWETDNGGFCATQADLFDAGVIDRHGVPVSLLNFQLLDDFARLYLAAENVWLAGHFQDHPRARKIPGW